MESCAETVDRLLAFWALMDVRFPQGWRLLACYTHRTHWPFMPLVLRWYGCNFYEGDFSVEMYTELGRGPYLDPQPPPEVVMRGCACTGALGIYCDWCTALLELNKRTHASIAARQPTINEVETSTPKVKADTQELTYEPPDALNAAEPEAAFQARVLRLATQHGFLCYHTHRSDRSAPGYPDICATNGTRLLFIECKSARGKLTKAQSVWLDLLRHTGHCEVYVLQPADWPTVEAIFTQHQGAPHA